LSPAVAFLAIRSIQRVVAGETVLRCEEDSFAEFFQGQEPLCRDRDKVMKSIDWTTLSFLSGTGCGANRFCIWAVFDRPNSMSRAMKVHVELSVGGVNIVNNQLRNAGELESAWITGVFHVD
jgi:hypothetical protein